MLRNFIILFFLLISANEDLHGQINSDIKGSWQGCFKNTYVEMHFFPDVYFVFFPEIESPIIQTYVVREDSLFRFEYLNSDQITFLYHVEIDNQKRLKFIEEKQLFYFKRLSPQEQIAIDISKNPESLQLYLASFARRMMKYDCENDK